MGGIEEKSCKNCRTRITMLRAVKKGMVDYMGYTYNKECAFCTIGHPLAFREYWQKE